MNNQPTPEQILKGSTDTELQQVASYVPISTLEAITGRALDAVEVIGYANINEGVIRAIVADTHHSTLEQIKGIVEMELPNALHKYGAWLLVNYEDVEPLERRRRKKEITIDLLNRITSEDNK